MKAQSDIMDSELGQEDSINGNGVAIRVQNLSKIYKLYDRSIDRLKESLHPLRRRYHHNFHALKDVSFEIGKGETFGIIGKNGSGKSTLLKIIAGVLTPSGGNIEIRGKVSALLELGIGFNPEMTGLENIYFSGTIMGYSKSEMDAKRDDILSFADIGEFIHQPVKTYSSGMFVRLAFAVATQVDPDILLVDEALAVGDMYFQSKCTLLMKRMIERGVTILFVSHDTTSVTNLCRSAIYFEHGMVKSLGDALSVSDHYLRDMRQLIYRASPSEQTNSKIIDETGFQGEGIHGCTCKKENVKTQPPFIDIPFKVDPQFTERVAPYRYGTGGARVLSLELVNENGELRNRFHFREGVIVRAHIECYKKIDFLNCCILIRNRNGVEIMHATSCSRGYAFPVLNAGDRIIVDISFQNILKGGEGYTIHYTVNDTERIETQEILDLIELAATFESVQDMSHLIYYLIWQPFEFRYRFYSASREAGRISEGRRAKIAVTTEYEEKISAVLREKYFDSFPEGYLATFEGKRDLDDHVRGRMLYAENTIVPWVSEVFNLEGKRGIEIGCGTGSSTIPFARKLNSLAAYEIGDRTLDVARARADLLGIKTVTFTAVAEDWALRMDEFIRGKKQVDVILLAAVLEHLTVNERVNVLRSAWELLVPGGIMIIYETPNRLNFYDWHTFLMPFFHWLPDELALTYSSRTTRQLLHGGADSIEKLYRLGRGVSFHEFDLALDWEEIAVLNDGYSSLIPQPENTEDWEFEKKLYSLLQKYVPHVPKGFARPNLDLVLQKIIRAEAKHI